MPICYFPPVTYFVCLASGRSIVIETGETFPKQTLRNRCEISTRHGKQILVVPVSKPGGNHTRTHEVLVSAHTEWRTKHWRAMETAYSSSPFFLYYSDSIREALFRRVDTLEQLNMALLKCLLSLTGLDPALRLSRDFMKDTEGRDDFRAAFSKKPFPLTKALPPYPQVFSHHTGFIGNLSILDLLFNLGPETPGYLQENNFFSQ